MKLSSDDKSDGQYIRRSTLALIGLHIDHLGKLDEFEQKLIPLLKEMMARFRKSPLVTKNDLQRAHTDYQYVCKLVRGHVAESEFKIMGDQLADKGWLVPSELSPDSEKTDGILARGVIKSAAEFKLVERYAKQLSARGKAAELKQINVFLASYVPAKK